MDRITRLPLIDIALSFLLLVTSSSSSSYAQQIQSCSQVIKAQKIISQEKINSPEANQEIGTNLTALEADNAKKKKFLLCDTTIISPLFTKEIEKMDTSGLESNKNLVIIKSAKKDKKKFEDAAWAIYALNNADVMERIERNFFIKKAHSWCEANHYNHETMLPNFPRFVDGLYVLDRSAIEVVKNEFMHLPASLLKSSCNDSLKKFVKNF